MLGSRNRCPVAVEVYSQLLRIFRLPLRSLLRGRLPARHPPLLQWPHQKPLPECPRQGRVGQDHRGSCRPRESTPTRQSHRAKIGSLSLSLRPSTGPNRQRQRIQRTLSLDESSASALRARRACRGRSRNLLGQAVGVDLLRLWKPPPSASHNALSGSQNWRRTPPISHIQSKYVRSRGARDWEL